MRYGHCAASLSSPGIVDDNAAMTTDPLPTASANSRHAVPVVGIIGGIGSGKSTISRWISEHHPVLVIDADMVGHRVLLEPQIIAALQATFGPRILNDHGQVDRNTLAQLVFGHGDAQRESRRKLEQIAHPAIRAAIEQQLAQIDPATYQAVLLDAAVLLEAGWADVCDAILYIDTPTEIRQARVATQRGWSVAELASREASQWPLDRKKQAAQAVIPNDGDVAMTGTNAWGVLRKLFTNLT